MGVFHGRTATLQGQFETEFRTPPVAPGTQLLKFSKLTLGQDADLAEDPTINAQALMDKRDEQDSTVSGQGEHILCLNDIGWWLKLLLGAPVTSGAGPYTHVFTLSLADRPSALLELALTENDAAPSTRFQRFLGMMVNALSFDIMEAQQNFNTELVGAVEVKPFPVAAFDVTPGARYAKSRACTKRGNVYDVLGASTLGEISKASVKFSNDLEGQKLADGNEGFGSFLLGQPMVDGDVTVLFTPGTLVDAALAHTSKKLVLATGNSAGTHSLTTTIPNVEFDRPKMVIETSKGLTASLKWRAHHVDAADPVTVTLVNAIATYA